MSNKWTFYRRISHLEQNKFGKLEGVLVNCKSKEGKLIASGPNIGLIFPSWIPGKENVLFVAPHDDDNYLGSGLLIQAVHYYDV